MLDKILLLFKDICKLPQHDYCILCFRNNGYGYIAKPDGGFLYLKNKQNKIDSYLKWNNDNEGITKLKLYLEQNKK